MKPALKARLELVALEGREVPSASMNDLFDSSDYLDDNSDVKAAVQSGQMTAIEHFTRYGQFEGRNPDRFFDSRAYLDDNPDVRDAVERHLTTAFEHFLRNGQFEGRDPGRYFDTSEYLDRYHDVRDAVEHGQMTAFEHFVRFGQFEGRSPTSGFDSSNYLDDNPDVRDAVEHGAMTSYEHFVRYGQYEDRSPSHEFVGRLYLEDNMDVAEAVRRGETTATHHFARHGHHEGRRMADRLTLVAGTPTVVEGVSQNHDDKKFYVFQAPANGVLQVNVEKISGDFAKLEIEDRSGSSEFETDPNDGINSGSLPLIAGKWYTMRLRALNNSPATYRVTLTFN